MLAEIVLIMTTLPALASVPPQHHELLIKTTSSGITLLKANRFRTRYTGNKFSLVDINGNLWLRGSELRKLLSGPKKVKAKKEARVETRADKNSFIMTSSRVGEQQNSENFFTSEQGLPTISSDLSTKKLRSYKVHKREVRQRLLGYINTQAGKKELYFWTVTFPMGTTDGIAYKIYNHWLTQLRQYKLLKEYLWVAERQGARSLIGNTTIHFHIAIPHKMPVQRANQMMRGILKLYAKRGEIPYSVFQCNRYNGVDICKHKVTKRVVNFAIKKGQKSLVGYLTKYVTKNDGEFTHLAWHNSRGFSSIFTGVTFTVAEFIAYGFHLQVDRRKGFTTEYFTFLPWIDEPPDLIMEHLYKINSYLQEQLN